VCLKGRGDFVGCLQRLVDGTIPCSVVNHVPSIPPSTSLFTDTLTKGSLSRAHD
jgi:hypothetical protein